MHINSVSLARRTACDDFTPPHHSRLWKCGFWSALVSSLSWIIPAGSLFGGATAPAFAEPRSLTSAMTPDDDAQFVAEFSQWIDATLTSGAFDAQPSVHSQFDLTGDGAIDHILIDPGDFFAADGRIAVVDGATLQVVYELLSPHNELCFGEFVGMWPDCNFDGVRELVVASGVQVGEQTALAVRVFSGRDGQLLAVVKYHHDAVVAEGDVLVAGDANSDSKVDEIDVSATAEVLGEPSAACPADLDIDGEKTVSDLFMVAAKAQVESQDPAVAAAICANLCRVNATGEGFVALTGPAMAGTGWVGGIRCWTDAAKLTLQVVGLLLRAASCGIATTAPPAAVACIVAWCCGFANFLSRLMLFSADCWGADPLSEQARSVVEIFEAVTDICNFALGDASVRLLFSRALRFLEGIRGRL